MAVLLAVLWLGQVVAGLFFREPADPRKLAIWIPAGLLAYSVWHLLKAACRTPIEPFEWTPAEREMLGAVPLRRRDLVIYRLITIAVAAVAKAACFSLVMLPDLHFWLAGFIGMFMALLFVDLVRMVIEILVYGMSGRAFLLFRSAVLGTAGICLIIALANSLPLLDDMARSELPAVLVVGLRIVNSVMNLRTVWFGWAAEIPFHAFGSVMLATGFSVEFAARLLLAAVLVVVLAESVVRLDQLIQRWRLAAERKAFQQHHAGTRGTIEMRHVTPCSVRIPVWLWGAGPLAWRQAIGAYRYRTSVGISLIVPGLLSCATLLIPQSGWMMLVQTVGGLVFYSFLLLPTALKFDFRRDVDRLATIKALPASPWAVTAGQLAVPVLLCTAFQMVVLLAAMVVRPYPLVFYVAAVMLLVPTNVLIFAMENVIFLLYPYRLSQEGLGVFLRTILTFTAKSLLFAVALVLMLSWALLARQIVTWLIPGSELVGLSIVFSLGVWVLITAAALGTSVLLARVYRRFDPSQDAPAIS